MNEITTRNQSTDVAEAGQDEGLTMLGIIARAASNPDVDVAKMQALLNMKREVEKDDALKAFIAARVNMQNALPSIGKKGEIKNKNGQTQSRYSRWEDIDRVIRPILIEFGFILSFENDRIDGMIAVQGVLSHVGGHVEKSGYLALPIDTSGSKNATQGIGSTVSYGKRYVTINFLNLRIEGEDDDGQTASARIEQHSNLYDAGEVKAKQGMTAYRNWFETSLSNEDRRILVETGDHDKLKKIADDYDFPGDR